MQLCGQVESYSWPAPGTGGDTDCAAMGFVEERQAFVKIDIPFFCAPDRLFVGADSFGRAGVFTNPAIVTELVNSKLSRRGLGNGSVRQHTGKGEMTPRIQD